MKELQFVESRQEDWNAWDRWLASPKPRPGETDEDGITVASLPRRFRRLSLDLALARDRRYSAALVESLHRRVLAAHQRIYSGRTGKRGALLKFYGSGLPRLVRGEWRFVLAAFLLFFVPMFIMLAALQQHPEGVYLVLSPEQVGEYEEMYSPDAKHVGRPRSASSEWAMWGFYIANNVQIDFQCFAGGIIFAVGAIFFLLFNGLSIGATAGYLTQLGYIDTFWGFVCGHSAFELTGAVLSGAAGLKIGFALLAPGKRSRLAALKEAAKGAIGLVYGAATLTFLAAFIEAFWSPIRAVPLPVKVGIGLALWLLTWSYLMLAGRGKHAA